MSCTVRLFDWQHDKLIGMVTTAAKVADNEERLELNELLKTLMEAEGIRKDSTDPMMPMGENGNTRID